MNNPYGKLRSLLDTTRQLDPEEMAELQLEQGYIERAAAIYERLAREHPANENYRRRREWLRRLTSVAKRPIRFAGPPSQRGAERPKDPDAGRPSEARRAKRVAIASVDSTLRGVLPPGRARKVTPPIGAFGEPSQPPRARKPTPAEIERAPARAIVAVD